MESEVLANTPEVAVDAASGWCPIVYALVEADRSG
jgi:hypothetical protein